MLFSNPHTLDSRRLSHSATVANIPSGSRAVFLYEAGKSPAIEVVERPTPHPGEGQVLVRMAAAPINPSDLSFLQGTYGIHTSFPVVPGIEGSGTVVAAGGGLLARRLLGRRVACSGLGSGDGAWAEYAVIDANRCLPVSSRISSEQAACLFVNPWTALALTELARQEGHHALVLSAGASQLSRMIFNVSRRHGISSIHVVRNAAQVKLLETMGVKYALDSTEPGFDGQLKQVCERLGAQIAFDAVAGEMTGRLVHAMPPGSRTVVYGALAQKPSQVDAKDLIFRRTTIEGFWLSHWLAEKTLLQLLKLGRQVQRSLSSDFKTEIREQVPLHEIQRALTLASSNTTAGKILLAPAGSNAADREFMG